jgi:hypothetical protein
MARSQDALQKRAAKRTRSVEEQTKSDGLEIARQKRLKRERKSYNQYKASDKQQSEADKHGMDEAGAWVCSSCGNHNFASRKVCHSKTCDQQKQSSGYERRHENKQQPKKRRHDINTLKIVRWDKNSSVETIQHNQELRRRFQETGGDGMDEADIQRAKVLLERDARKLEKKLGKKLSGGLD